MNLLVIGSVFTVEWAEVWEVVPVGEVVLGNLRGEGAGGIGVEPDSAGWAIKWD